jgi:FkbM family methyltransferase
VIASEPMQSFAQNAEDVVLWRVFRDLDRSGFFIDVGAGHPIIDSVTKHFSLSGWSGVHIEPMERECELLRQDRPGDVVLQVALADVEGTATLFEAPLENRGASSLRADIAAEQTSETSVFAPSPVAVRTLRDVCEEYVIGSIDFLKIDVEGYEAAVIKGADWQTFRPTVVVVEATHPQTTFQTHAEWEPDLLAARYLFAMFDGLNRYYVREEDASLLPRLAIPANVLDNFVPYRWVHEVDVLREFNRSLETEIEKVQRALAIFQAQESRFAEQQRALATSARRMSCVEAALDRAEADAVSLRATNALTRLSPPQ